MHPAETRTWGQPPHWLSEEDEDGNVVRQLNMDDMDVDDEVDSLGKSQDNILSQLSKTCKQYTPNTSKSGYKKARKHFKTVCEILGEICDEAEEESSSCGESSQSEDEDESVHKRLEDEMMNNSIY